MGWRIFAWLGLTVYAADAAYVFRWGSEGAPGVPNLLSMLVGGITVLSVYCYAYAIEIGNRRGWTFLFAIFLCWSVVSMLALLLGLRPPHGAGLFAALIGELFVRYFQAVAIRRKVQACF